MNSVEANSVAVIGSGLMGRGIAYVAAVGGFETRLFDSAPAALDRAKAQIETDLAEGVRRAKLDAADAAKAQTRISYVSTLADGVRGVDCVIEAIPEIMALKIETFAAIEASAPRHAILATNTSGLSITEIAAALRTPSRLVGMHFFNPVPKMKLVEIIRGLETEDSVVKATEEIGRRMGKETVVIKESPGFITSRINAMIGNEAFDMLDKGVASARDIDKALKLGLNHPMGPFEMVDVVGLDTRLAVLEYLHKTLGERYRPSPLLVQHVKAGRLGRKVGRGVYDYSEAAQGGKQ